MTLAARLLAILGVVVMMVYFGAPFGFDLAHVTGVIDYRSLGAPEATALAAESRHWASYLVAGCNVLALAVALTGLILRRWFAVWCLAISLLYVVIPLVVLIVAESGGRRWMDTFQVVALGAGFVLGVMALAAFGLRRLAR